MEDEKLMQVMFISSDPDALPADAPPGDESPAEIYVEVGRALTVWENLEETLGKIFSLLMGPESFEMARRAYGRVTAFNTRKAMLVEAFGSYRHRNDPAIGNWSKLFKNAAELAVRRNEIAHGVVNRWEQNGRLFGYYLLPNSFNSLKNRSEASLRDEQEMFVLPQNFRYVANDIRSFVEQVNTARQELDQLLAGVIGLLKGADNAPK